MYFSARSVFLISRALRASVWRIPLTLLLLSTTGKLVKPDLYNLSNTNGPRMSLLLTKSILSFGIIRSETLRSSKLMTAAIRARSVELKIFFGVRCKTPINSSIVLGVYLGLTVDLDSRYLSSLGSRNLTILHKNSCHMI